MSILSLPVTSRTAPSAMTFSLQPNTMRAESPLNRAVQTAELPGARWIASFSYQNLNDADARIYKAWLNRLVGMAGRFYLCDYTHPAPAGTAAGAPLVNGAGQAGRSIITDGWTVNQANLLLPGDYIGIGGELKVITSLASSNSSGIATLTFEPPLRAAAADNSAIITNQPTCVMMLSNDQQDKFTFSERNVTNLQIDCLEMF